MVLTKPPLLDETGKSIRDALLMIAGGQGADTTWAHIRDNVLEGHGPLLYPVGTQFITPHTTYGNIVWEVTGHDQIASATGKAHTMTLLSKNALTGNSIQFDSSEAAFAAPNGLAAGTYHFTVTSQPWYGGDVGVTFQFTLANAVPAGGQIYISGPYNDTLNGKTVYTYANGSSTTATNTATLSVGSGGTNLGALDVDGNHIHRIFFGSSNYKESAMRQFLNSDGAAGTYWTPQTKYDRPPSWNGSLIGFKKGFESDFLSAIDTPAVKCSTNNTFESQDSTTPINSQYTVADQFFLPSRYEIFGSSDVADGSVMMSYFVGATNEKRIRRYNGSAVYWWMRTPNSGNAHYVRFVLPDGSLTSDYADGNDALVPACII